MSDFSDAFNRFLGGHNDAPQVSAAPMVPGLTGGSAQWTEADYQAALDLYKRMTPEQRYAAGMTGPPPPPELSPGIANVNLQRGHFNPYLASLEAAAAGQGPSQAQNALREGTAATVATQYGMAATPSVGGAAQAALVQNAQNKGAEAMQAGARQAAQLRAQEMTDARQQLGQALQQQQGINLQGSGLITEREKANQQAGISAGGINAQVGEQNRGGIANIWHQAMSSDIRAKEDITPLQSFTSTLGTAATAPMGVPQQTNPFDYHNYMSDESTQAAAPVAAKESAGLLSSIFSDERSKDHIRALEGALAESRRTADTIGGTHISYPGIRGSGAVPTVPQGAARPFAPGEYIDNNDGSWSSERSMTVTDPRLNGGRATIIPSLWIRDGNPYQARDEREASDLAAASGVPFRGYGSIPEAERASIDRERRWQKLSPETSGQMEPLWTPQGSRQALAPVAPYEYRYKPQFAAATGDDTAPRAGVMAQDLERSPSPALRSAVVETPMGKAIDGKRALSANLALSAGLDKRLRNIEGALSQPTVYPNLAR
jgi:hypothetical protein